MMNLGYVISAVGPNIIEWLCLDKLLHRKNISTPVMLLFAIGSGIIIALQTQFAYDLILNQFFPFFCLPFVTENLGFIVYSLLYQSM